VHCLKYGLTTNNLLGIEMVLMTARSCARRQASRFSGGYDLLGLMTGSEGLLGVVTEVTVRILRKPSTARAVLIGFPTEAAGDCVAAIIAAGIIPGGMEMMDRPRSMRRGLRPRRLSARCRGAADRRTRRPPAEVDHLIERVAASRKAAASPSASATSEAERLLFWAGRKAAFPAVGRISPDYMCMDGTIPRGKLPEVLARDARALAKNTACASPTCSMPATATCIR
jgi:glycolate oxidase